MSIIKKHYVTFYSPGTFFTENSRVPRWPLIIENTNSWKFTGEFTEEHIVVNKEGEILIRGNDPMLVKYRKKKIEEFEKE